MQRNGACVIETRSAEIQSTGGVVLEARLDLPDTAPDQLNAGVVICHPHPQYGGEMTNSVVTAISAALTARGMAVLRFNFRGVGRSTGAYADGIGEREDAAAALDLLASGELISVPRVALAGYSFGGGVAIETAMQRPELPALALVSPALSERSMEGLDALTMPKIIATGEADTFATVERVRDVASRLPGSTEVYVAPQADHFWWGAEEELGRRIGEFFHYALRPR